MENSKLGTEARLKALEEQVRDLKTALLGTLDGKPGALAVMRRALELSEEHATQLDSLRLDRAKVAGIVVAVSVLWSLALVFLRHFMK